MLRNESLQSLVQYWGTLVKCLVYLLHFKVICAHLKINMKDVHSPCHDAFWHCVTAEYLQKYRNNCIVCSRTHLVPIQHSLLWEEHLDQWLRHILVHPSCFSTHTIQCTGYTTCIPSSQEVSKIMVLCYDMIIRIVCLHKFVTGDFTAITAKDKFACGINCNAQLKE